MFTKPNCSSEEKIIIQVLTMHTKHTQCKDDLVYIFHLCMHTEPVHSVWREGVIHLLPDTLDEVHLRVPPFGILPELLHLFFFFFFFILHFTMPRLSYPNSAYIYMWPTPFLKERGKLGEPMDTTHPHKILTRLHFHKYVTLVL